MARRNWAVRLISFAVTFPITMLVLLFAVSNRHLVAMELWPLPGGLDAPLYLVALLALAAGFVLGGTVAWAGEWGHKRRAARAEKHARDLDRELSVMRVREEQIRAEAGTAIGRRPALADQRQG